jgi:hypothetical protein
VRTIASRARRSGVLHEHLGDVDLEASKALYRTLSVRARRLVEAAATEAEIQRASRMLAELRDLEGVLAKAPAPSSQGALASSILASHRGGGVYTPEPEPVRAPAREPEPAPLPQTPGEWIRQQVAALMEAQKPAKVPPRSASDGIVDDSDVIRAERGHPAFGLHRQDFWKGRITRGLLPYGGPPG